MTVEEQTANTTEVPELDSPRTAVKVLLAVALLALYMFGQPWELRGHIVDVQAATIPAWHFVETGSWELSEYQDLNPYFVDTDRGVRSNRTPGIIAVAALGYGATKPFTNDFENWPGTLVAVITSWLAVLFAAASAERLRKGLWFPTFVLFGLGTATWAVAAEQLWPQGPGQLAIAIGVWFLIRKRDLSAGLAFAVAVLIRPPTAVLGLGVAAVKAFHERSLRPLLTIGGPSVAAATFYLLYTRIIFGSWNPAAPYDAVGGFWKGDGVVGWIQGTISSFVGLEHGIFVWSAWLAVCAAVVTWRRPNAPSWLKLSPLVAVAYMVIHAAIEVPSGGLFFNYRYPLEAITLATPFLVMVVPDILGKRSLRLVFALAAGLALFLQGAFVFLSRCYMDQGVFQCSLIA